MSAPKGAPPILLVEDAHAADFGPLTRLRPAFELRLGALSLRERAECCGVPVHARVRPELKGVLRESMSDLAAELEVGARVLALNARATASVDEILALLTRASADDFAIGSAEDWVAIACRVEDLDAGIHDFEAMSIALATRPWNLVHGVGEQIAADFAAMGQCDIPARRVFGVQFDADSAGALAFASPFATGDSRFDSGVHMLELERIHIAHDVTIAPGVVLDASGGPIILGAHVSIGANSVVKGPAVIGPGSVVHPLTRVREASAIGGGCKIGGELEDCIVLDWSNKQHDGFLGHAYVGSWVNLGADTTVSDLKNNYGEVRADFGEGLIATGQRFVGPTIGDHAKTAIGTLLGTGTTLDVGCNVVGAGFPPRYVQPFAWGGFDDTATDPERAMSTLDTVFGRRAATPVPAMRALLRALCERA